MQLDLNRIRLDGGTQPRAELLLEVIEDYAEQMRSGAEFPPVTVFFDGKEYWLADGFHRVMAARQARPGQPIEVDVQQGTQSQAQWFSYSANKSHGLRRTNEDKRRAIVAALSHPTAANMSDSSIAEHCGVDHKTVARHRAELHPTWEIPKSRTGRDGRTINTANIGSRPKAPQRSSGSRSRLTIHTPRSPEQQQVVDTLSDLARRSADAKLELPHNNARSCAYALLEHFSFPYLEIIFAEVVALHQQRLQEETA